MSALRLFDFELNCLNNPHCLGSCTHHLLWATSWPWLLWVGEGWGEMGWEIHSGLRCKPYPQIGALLRFYGSMWIPLWNLAWKPSSQVGLGVNQRAFAHLGVGTPAPVDWYLGGMQCCVDALSDFLSYFFPDVKLSHFSFLWQLCWLAGLGSKPWAKALGFSVLIYKLVMVSPFIGLLDQMRK